jgi:PIN domain nuclease of toxin-antitoxin system
MPALVLDTHAAIWLLFRSQRLSEAARAACDEARRVGDPIFLPSISLVELRYLVERGRFPESAFDLLDNAVARPNPILMLAPLDLSVVRMLGQIPRADVPDMPDRIIAATALARGLPLVSRDRQIRAAQITIIW